MTTISEMIVLLWLVPVAINIILPLSVLGIWSCLRVLGLVRSHGEIEDEVSGRQHAY